MDSNKNTGDRSTGNRSTGDWSTGYRSTGNWSTGDWSTSNHSTGHFSTEDFSGFGVFNKACSIEEWETCKKPDLLYFILTEWVKESEMTSDEKESNPTYKTTEGYLKVKDYKEAFKESYNKASEEDKELLLKLPNFDADVFLEISGIDVRNNDNSKEIEEITEQMEVLKQRIKSLEK